MVVYTEVPERRATVPRRGTTEVESVMRPKLTPEQRFWAKVNQDGPISGYAPHLGNCWLWTAAQRHGYGDFWSTNGRYAHQFLVGKAPEGLVWDHLCRVRPCVRPSHLEPVTNAENIRRGLGGGKYQRERTHCPKGHAYSVENTYIDKSNHRHCRLCHAARMSVWQKAHLPEIRIRQTLRRKRLKNLALKAQ